MDRQIQQRQRYRDEYPDENDSYTPMAGMRTPGPLKEIFNWIAFFALAALGIMVAVFVFNNVDLVLSIGKVLFIVLCVVAVVLILCLVVVTIAWCMRFVTRVQAIEPGEKGTWVRDIWGRMKLVHPVKEATVKQAVDKYNNGDDVKTGMLKFADLLTDTVLPGMLEILLGMTVPAFDKLVGSWEDLKTFAVYGFGRVGKTNTLIFYIIQAIFTGATVWVCDFHTAKGTGLSNLLQPLRKWITFYTTPEEFVQAFLAYNQELENRQQSSVGTHFPVWFLAVDEWNGYLDKVDKNSRKRVIAIAERLSREAAGFNMFGMFAIHELSDKQIGSVTLRQSFLGVVCHALDVGYSKWVFTNGKHQKQTASLAKGEVLLRNAETREVTHLRIPKILPKDIVTAAQKMYDYEQENTLDSGYEQSTTPAIQYADSMFYDNPTQQLYSLPDSSSNTRLLPDTNYQGTRQEANGTVIHAHVPASTSVVHQGTQMPVAAPTGSNQTEKQEDIDLMVLRRIGKRIKDGEEPNQIRKSLLGNKSGRALQEVNEAMQLAQELVDSEA